MPDERKADPHKPIVQATLAEILEEAQRLRNQSEALNERMAELPNKRGQNENGMGGKQYRNSKYDTVGIVARN